jgi:hypothetical protein
MGMEELELRALAPGDTGRLLAAYQVACGLAEQLRAALAAGGISADAAEVVASLDSAGRPAVQLALSGAAAGRLAGLMAAAGGPARHSVPTHPPSAAA